ncbi:MAG: Uma2 family endonuclease [Caldilineaceae bacterium]
MQINTDLPFGDWPQQGEWTYEDFLRLPDVGKRYEIIEGRLYIGDSPTMEHQYALQKILFQIHLLTEASVGGMVLIGPIGVHLSETTKPIQPDGLYIKQDRLPPKGTEFIEFAPDLIVEVISPSSIRLDRHIKFDAYERYGVAEYWLVDPKARLVEVYTWQRGEYALWGQYTEDDIVTSQLLEGLAIKASLLFQPKS